MIQPADEKRGRKKDQFNMALVGLLHLRWRETEPTKQVDVRSSPTRWFDHILSRKKTRDELRHLARRDRKWNLERAIAAKTRRPRGKRIHSSTLLKEKLRQRRLLCGTPAISRAGAGAGRRRGLRGATYAWRGRTSKGRVRVCAKTEPLSPTRTIPDASSLPQRVRSDESALVWQRRTWRDA
jgi:hypothetical protein